MAITYPLTLPNRPAPSRFSIDAASLSAVTQSPWSAGQQVQLNQGQLWTISADFPPMDEGSARNWFSTLVSLRGRYGTFLYGPPTMKAPRGNWGSAPVVNGSTQSGQTLAVGGLPASAVIRAGDYFQLGSGLTSRLYMVTQDAVADGSGLATLDIWPRLRFATVDGEAITTASPRSLFRLGAPNVALAWQPFRYEGISLQMIEAV